MKGIGTAAFWRESARAERDPRAKALRVLLGWPWVRVSGRVRQAA